MRYEALERIGNVAGSEIGSRLEKLIFGIFLAIGLLFFVIGAGFGVARWAVTRDYQSAEAVIVDLDRENTPTVQFRVGDKTFTKKLNSSSNLYEIGEIIRIAYDSETPGRMLQLGVIGWLFPLIFGGVGLVFAVIGGTFLILIRKREKRAGEDRPEPWEI